MPTDREKLEKGQLGWADTFAIYRDFLPSLLRGAVTGTAGLPGELEDLAKSIISARGGEATARVFPRSEEISEYLPPVREGEKPNLFEKTGEFLPLSPGKAVAAVGPTVLAKAGPAAATALLHTPAAIQATKAALSPKTKDIFVAIKRGSSSPGLQMRAEEASRMLRKGKSPEDIWKEAGVIKQEDPFQTAGTLSEPDVWMHEVLPEQGQQVFKPQYQMSAEGRENLNEHLAKKNMYHAALAANPERKAEFVNKSDFPRAIKDVSLGEATQHPVLEHLPALKDTRLTTFQKGQATPEFPYIGDRSYGLYDHAKTELQPQGRVYLGTPTAFQPLSAEDMPGKVFEHELQHAVSRHQRLPSGGMPEGTPQELDDLQKNIRHAINELGDDPEAETFVNQLAAITTDPHINYENFIDERKARLAAERLGMSEEELAKLPQLKNDSGTPLDAEFYRHILEEFRKNPNIDLAELFRSSKADYTVGGTATDEITDLSKAVSKKLRGQ